MAYVVRRTVTFRHRVLTGERIQRNAERSTDFVRARTHGIRATEGRNRKRLARTLTIATQRERAVAVVELDNAARLTRRAAIHTERRRALNLIDVAGAVWLAIALNDLVGSKDRIVKHFRGLTELALDRTYRWRAEGGSRLNDAIGMRRTGVIVTVAVDIPKTRAAYAQGCATENCAALRTQHQARSVVCTTCFRRAAEHAGTERRAAQCDALIGEHVCASAIRETATFIEAWAGITWSSRVARDSERTRSRRVALLVSDLNDVLLAADDFARRNHRLKRTAIIVATECRRGRLNRRTRANRSGGPVNSDLRVNTGLTARVDIDRSGAVRRPTEEQVVLNGRVSGRIGTVGVVLTERTCRSGRVVERVDAASA